VTISSVDLGIPGVPSGLATSTRPRPDSPGLIDSFGRAATDLRVSLTDRCNLRCTYCMPAEGLDWLRKPELLTDAEIIRLIRIAVTRLGITEIRFTGGEPLLRPGLTEIIAATASLRPRPRMSMTTNGINLVARAGELAAAGLNRINVSLDTLRPDRFRQVARRDRLADVLAGLAAAADAGLTPVKINAVLLREINDDEAPDLLRYGLDNGYHVRFIEQMPLDPQHGWSRADMVTAEEILDRLRAAGFRLTASPTERGSAPAE
jgi:cyclic pyranopterin phosphate synthase